MKGGKSTERSDSESIRGRAQHVFLPCRRTARVDPVQQRPRQFKRFLLTLQKQFEAPRRMLALI